MRRPCKIQEGAFTILIWMRTCPTVWLKRSTKDGQARNHWSAADYYIWRRSSEFRATLKYIEKVGKKLRCGNKDAHRIVSRFL